MVREEGRIHHAQYTIVFFGLDSYINRLVVFVGSVFG